MASKTQELAIKIAGKMDSSLKNAVGGANKQLESLGNVAKKLGGVLAGALSIATVAKMGSALYDMGEQFKEAENTIRVGTGATGAALEDLSASMDNVYTRIPAELGDSASAIADYNTRLGLTGPILEDLSVQALQVSDLLGEDLSNTIEKSSKAFQQWGIEEDNMAGKMDYIFKVSQSTGMGFNDLLNDMQKFGPQLQDMGYSFDTASALMGQLDKAGVNVDEVLGAMKKSVGAMAKEGLSASAGLEKYYKKIKSARTEAEAASIAAEVFGSRAGSTMSAAIRDGSLSVDELTKSLQDSDETIAKAAEDTYTFADKWKIFKQNLSTAIKPAAMELFDTLGNQLEAMLPYLQQALPAITAFASALADKIGKAAGVVVPLLTNGFQAIGDFIQNRVVPAIGTIREVLSPIMDAVMDVGGKFADALSPAMDLFYNVKDVGGLAFSGLMEMAGEVVPYIASGFEAVGGTIAKVLGAAMPWISRIVAKLRTIIPPILDAAKQIGAKLLPVFQTAGHLISEVIVPAITSAIDFIAPKIIAVVGKIGPAISAVMNVVVPIISGFAERVQIAISAVSGVFEGVVGTISGVIGNITDAIGGVIDFITGVFTGDWEKAWNGVTTVFDSVFGALAGIAKVPINAVIGAINGVISGINSLHIEIPEWSPILPGKVLGFDIAPIPYLAEGGIATGPTLAMIGEGNEDEAVLPLSKLSALLGGDGVSSGGEIVFAPVLNFYGNTTEREAKQARDDLFREFKQFMARYERENKRVRFV